MIKTRLVALLSHAKKYIIQNVFWQWAALLRRSQPFFPQRGFLRAPFPERQRDQY